MTEKLFTGTLNHNKKKNKKKKKKVQSGQSTFPVCSLFFKYSELKHTGQSRGRTCMFNDEVIRVQHQKTGTAKRT